MKEIILVTSAIAVCFLIEPAWLWTFQRKSAETGQLARNISQFLIETGDNETETNLAEFKSFLSSSRRRGHHAGNDSDSKPTTMIKTGLDGNWSIMSSSTSTFSYAEDAKEKLLWENVTADDFVWFEKPTLNNFQSDGQYNMCKNKTATCGIIIISIIAVTFLVILFVTLKCCPTPTRY